MEDEIEGIVKGGLWAQEQPAGTTMEDVRRHVMDTFNNADFRDDFMEGARIILEPSAEDEGIDPENGEPV